MDNEKTAISDAAHLENLKKLAEKTSEYLEERKLQDDFFSWLKEKHQSNHPTPPGEVTNEKEK